MIRRFLSPDIFDLSIKCDIFFRDFFMGEKMKGITFQEMIFRLQRFWTERGCILVQPWDIEMGAGTFHPATFFYALNPANISSVYVQPSRRPTDGRYGESPNTRDRARNRDGLPAALRHRRMAGETLRRQAGGRASGCVEPGEALDRKSVV